VPCGISDGLPAGMMMDRDAFDEVSITARPCRREGRELDEHPSVAVTRRALRPPADALARS